MSKPKVEVLPIEQGATVDLNNVNRHTQRARGFHENSMRRRGMNRSIASAGKDVDIPVTTAGNQTLEIAAEIGIKEIVNVYVDGTQLVNVVRTDIAPGTAEAIALGLEDNFTAHEGYNPDIDLLAQMAAGDHALLKTLRKQDDIFNGILEQIGADVPHFEPVGIDEQGRLDKKSPVICPNCKYEFVPR